MNYSKIDANKLRSGKRRLFAAFADLRKLGFLAKSNFWCCMTCAYSAIEFLMKEENLKPTGIVFYHSQNNTHMRETGFLHLTFSHAGEIDNSVEIGKQIVEILAKHKLETEWDGTADKKILVHIIPQEKK
jgi:hypothetical protein